MFENILPTYKKTIKYGFYLLILLNMLDIISTYIGIKYFNAYEANERTAYLFELFGMFLPSALKILVVVMLGYTIKTQWRSTMHLLSDSNGWTISIAVISGLNLVFLIFFLNFVYFLIVLNNINIIYNF
ncbi:Uncharacterised protein [uncultured archaeon]|nr:Uncharacterised protein [uncultured archaeon]